MKATPPEPDNPDAKHGDEADLTPAPPRERPAGDELLGVEGVMAMFPHETSRWWVRTMVAPADRMRIGKRCYWWRSDVVAWLNRHKQGPE